MRPYMLWLTRVYSGTITGYGKAFLSWPNVLDDWLSRLGPERYRNEYARRIAQKPTNPGRGRARRMSIARRNPRLEALQLADWSRARAAGQGRR